MLKVENIVIVKGMYYAIFKSGSAVNSINIDFRIKYSPSRTYFQMHGHWVLATRRCKYVGYSKYIWNEVNNFLLIFRSQLNDILYISFTDLRIIHLIVQTNSCLFNCIKLPTALLS